MRKQTSKSSSIWGVDSLFGIYIHIPFCKKACTYCDFHFSTAIQSKKPVLKAINSELILRKDEYFDVVDSIYFGGGTPTLLQDATKTCFAPSWVEGFLGIDLGNLSDPEGFGSEVE